MSNNKTTFKFWGNDSDNTSWSNISSNDKKLIDQYLRWNRDDYSSKDIIDFAEELNKQATIKYLKLLQEQRELIVDDTIQINRLKDALQITPEHINESIEVHLRLWIIDAKWNLKFLWSRREYVLNQRHEIKFFKINWRRNMYQTTIVMKRNSRSSLRWDQKINLTFYYDWKIIKFFNSNWSRSQQPIWLNRRWLTKAVVNVRSWKINLILDWIRRHHRKNNNKPKHLKK